LALKFSKENIFFIKFFQAVCTTSHPLLTDDVLQYLNTFTDNAPYTISEIDTESLERLIKDNSIEIKKPFVPIKSGTISLIFEGTISKNTIGNKSNLESVIIKCKRLGIDDKIRRAIFNMDYLISFTKIIPHIKKLNVYDIYSENKQSIFDQLLFHKEVQNIELYYSKWNKPGLEYIKIPKVYSDITQQNPNVIVMERIIGNTIYNIHPEDKDRYGKLLAKFNFKSVFYDSMYHGDIHPGNIFFIKELKVKSSPSINDNNSENSDDDNNSENSDDNNSENSDDDNNSENKCNDTKKYNYKIGVIDFGIVGRFSREMQNTIFQLFKFLYEKSHEKVAYCIVNNLIEPKDVLTSEKKSELIEIVSKYSEKHFDKDAHRFLDAEDIIKINKILYSFGVQFSKEFCKIELSFAISDSVCKLLTNKTTYLDQLLTIFSKYS
jgi:predicted unusual protein kinase regulating ubiquinone biosynthesis (AarF/ABC1/UbiB family)